MILKLKSEKLTATENRYLTDLLLRDSQNLIYLLLPVVFWWILYNNEYEFANNLILIKTILALFVLGIIGFFIFVMLHKYRCLNYYKHGKWYCPFCDYEHKRRHNTYVSCNRSIGINSKLTVCNHPDRNYFHEKYRRFSFRDIWLVSQKYFKQYNIYTN